MKKTLWIYAALIMILTGSFFLYGCGSESDTSSDSAAQQAESGSVYKDISADELKSLIDTNKNLLVVDVREQFEYDAGHLANSMLIPTSEFTNRVNELPKEKAIAVVCATGARSAQVARYLAESGYSEVYNLAGGLSSWPGELVK